MGVDPLTPQARSAQMARVKHSDTKPEMNARRAAHRLGYRFRLHRRDLPGTPDMVFPKLRKIIMVNGCFWHQHEGCRRARLPKSRPEYWLPKLARNKERDEQVIHTLNALGWDVLTLWECQAKNVDAACGTIAPFLSGKGEQDGH